MEYYTYLYTDPSRDEPIYVGKGKGTRAQDHLEATSLKKNKPFPNRLKRMKRDGIEPVITYLAKDVSEDAALAIEIFWVAVLGRKCEKIGPLLNLDPGGRGRSGQVLSEDHRSKISTSLAVVNATSEVKATRSAASKARWAKPGHLEAVLVGRQGSTKWADGRKNSGKKLSKACTVDGITIYSTVNEMKAQLGQKARRLPSFRFIERE